MTKKEEEQQKLLPFFRKSEDKFALDGPELKLVLFLEPNEIEGAPMLVGFPNIGITPVLTASYLVKDLDLPLIGSVQPKTSLTRAVVSNEGQPGRAIRVFGDKRLVVICSEFKLKDEFIHEFCKLVAQLSSAINSSMIWCVEGVPVERTDRIEREEMHFLTTSSDMASRLTTGGHKVIHDSLIAGVSGGIISEIVDGGTERDMTILLAPTSSFYPDAWSSVMLIRLLDSLYDTWTSDTEKLENSASSLEETVKKLMASNLRKSSESYSSMYY